ncbi:MAG TPA: STAS domain-containing protein [Ramlibacter sp.]|uniref:STAS domain-containing protein n=1 Tax=Ramlibacter sp. TaxID=1917967 RepID=UPI002D7FDC01|nr:STAS domain-containing protein [Ramlibacter sp.]HET8745704.1 STAS domain-containing protein [Ramlibacter sp.]
MAQKDDSAAGGLLSRVVRFVKSPTAWGESGAETETDRESSYSKQMLKEMIERKRRNDFVRKREFDMLRKMRRSEVLAGQDPGLRPSFFQSSMPSKPDDRATTLKKIDEIEAQMSMQWWKTKHGNASQQPANSGFALSSNLPPDAVQKSPPPAATSYSRTSPQELRANAAAAAPAAASEPMLQSVLPQAFARPGAEQHPAAAPAAGAAPGAAARTPAAAPATGAQAGAAPAAAPGREGGAPSIPSVFSHSKQYAIQVEEFAHDPELEEASIRFANGDDEGAEAGLIDVLGPQGSRVNHDETWLTLFDLYRATGKQDRFESAAIEFASRFGRSAPQWFSMPEIVGRMSSTTSSAPLHPGQSIADWTSPAVFGTQTLAALNAALAKASPPYKLNWTKLNSIVESAIEPLTKLFTQWAGQNVQLRFIGADALEKVLKDHTSSGDRSVNPAWWKLRMEVLRVMHRPDEFELVALDYCVTYEVSPPSWDSARCEYKAMQPDGSLTTRNTIVGDAFRDSVMSSIMTYGDSQLAAVTSQMSSVATVELSGQVLGDGKEALELLDAKLGDADVMIISCARLMRIDFTAAGTLLNWVTARVSEGRQVQFVDVHRLVAAFFNVIGISEHARIGLRVD